MRKYYVYKHVDPETKELLYIGKGSGTRAWEFNGDRTKLNHAFGTRYKDHSDHLRRLIRGGYLPSEWVKIVKRRLTNSEAHKYEAELLQKYRPRFNKIKGGGMAKFSKSQVRRIQNLYAAGFSSYKIAARLRCSPSTAYNIARKKIKYYGNYYK